MKNKNPKNKELKPQGFRGSKDKKRKSDALFDLDSNSDYPWWEKLLLRILLPHKNKFIDRIVDMGCLLMVIALAGVILFMVTWIFNLLQKVIY